MSHLPSLQSAMAQKRLRALDVAFADFLAQHDPDFPPVLHWLAALVSHQLGEGHLCLDLRLLPEMLAEQPWPEPWGTLAATVCADGIPRLPASRLLADAGGLPADAPLVLDGPRLYLRRNWDNERAVARGVLDRIGYPPPSPTVLRAELDRLFPQRAAGAPDWQRIACALAARNGFAVITGGPGTGKTTTVVRLLALLQTVHRRDHTTPLRIHLAAPTGKAAARLGEAIGTQVAQLDVDAGVRAAIPTEVTTLHRLLGARPDTRRYRHDRSHPLYLDVLVVDEASMVDLEMMAALLAALPASARLILLGDKDQLASVEAGAVLGDLCRFADHPHYDAATLAWLEAATGIAVDAAAARPAVPVEQAIASLRTSHRFAADSGIGQLASAVNAGDATTAQALLAGTGGDLAWLPGADDQVLDALVLGHVVGTSATPPHHGLVGYLDWLQAARPAAGANEDAYAGWASGALAALNRFQLLCALRQGPLGVDGINQRVAHLLHRQHRIDAEEGWYEGRPVLVTRNDYRLGLMNGDVGLCLRVPAPASTQDTRLVVAFPAAPSPRADAAAIRFVAPSRLTEVETAFALTVHKAQGSEFDHVALLLPPAASAVATRELLYTAITRARRSFTLVGTEAVIAASIARRTQRHSGLGARLQAGETAH